MIGERYGIPRRRLTGLMSPWALKRLEAFGGDISRFSVAKISPSRLRQIAGERSVLSIKRSASASPATGSAKAHEVEQKTLLTLAFTTKG